MNTGIGATESWQGIGINSDSMDYVDIDNNVILSKPGLTITLLATGCAGSGSGSLTTLLSLRDTATREIIGSAASTNLIVDNNLYYSTATLANQFIIVPQAFSHDQHSVFANPLFVSTNPAVASDFRLSSSEARPSRRAFRLGCFRTSPETLIDGCSARYWGL